MTTTNAVDIVEVGPRDGYQGIKPFIPTPAKITLLKRLIATGLKRIEIGSFVSAIALPQLADTPEILAFCRDLPDIVPQVLVPNKKYGCLAIDSGAGFLAFVLSVSESHNRSNVKRSPQDSIEEYRLLLAAMPEHIDVRLNLATAFDCPFEGRVAETNTIGLLDLLVPMRPEVELCLCDTTGRAS